LARLVCSRFIKNAPRFASLGADFFLKVDFQKKKPQWKAKRHAHAYLQQLSRCQSYFLKKKGLALLEKRDGKAMGEYFCEGFHLKNPIQAIFSCNMNHTSQREREQKGESSGAEPTSGLTTDN
tara:strand:- start:314 stop:682 length:369 start_codon:yes stop_codon:yes gene_type:complete